jgi:hypothetical protein
MLRAGCETERWHLSSEALASPSVTYLIFFARHHPPTTFNLPAFDLRHICSTPAHPSPPKSSAVMGARQKPP